MRTHSTFWLTIYFSIPPGMQVHSYSLFPTAYIYYIHYIHIFTISPSMQVVGKKKKKTITSVPPVEVDETVRPTHSCNF